MNSSNAVSRLAPLRTRLAGRPLSLPLPNTFRIDAIYGYLAWPDPDTAHGLDIVLRAANALMTLDHSQSLLNSGMMLQAMHESLPCQYVLRAPLALPMHLEHWGSGGAVGTEFPYTG